MHFGCQICQIQITLNSEILASTGNKKIQENFHFIFDFLQ